MMEIEQTKDEVKVRKWKERGREGAKRMRMRRESAKMIEYD